VIIRAALYLYCGVAVTFLALGVGSVLGWVFWCDRIRGVGAEVLLWLVGFQQGIKDLVRGYIVFIVQMIIFSEFCVNVIPLSSVEVCPFVMALQYSLCVLNRAE
jgi:hypothetical protein